ncbi:hypothetical protein EVAR_95775_1 [Eumeta japonica]|uniref:Uncharacterized protein n=1 Tax=Eumeta variegata TaxID=151549 RepID=A0A4C1UKY8_EUMVA|nr:hypothetical protein EVAR_95775_1 [Eumeta japonica]
MADYLRLEIVQHSYFRNAPVAGVALSERAGVPAAGGRRFKIRHKSRVSARVTSVENETSRPRYVKDADRRRRLQPTATLQKSGAPLNKAVSQHIQREWPNTKPRTLTHLVDTATNNDL